LKWAREDSSVPKCNENVTYPLIRLSCINPHLFGTSDWWQKRVEEG
jgi:hypothetical protein